MPAEMLALVAEEEADCTIADSASASPPPQGSPSPQHPQQPEPRSPAGAVDAPKAHLGPGCAAADSGPGPGSGIPSSAPLGAPMRDEDTGRVNGGVRRSMSVGNFGVSHRGSSQNAPMSWRGLGLVALKFGGHRSSAPAPHANTQGADECDSAEARSADVALSLMQRCSSSNQLQTLESQGSEDGSRVRQPAAMEDADGGAGPGPGSMGRKGSGMGSGRTGRGGRLAQRPWAALKAAFGGASGGATRRNSPGIGNGHTESALRGQSGPARQSLNEGVLASSDGRPPRGVLSAQLEEGRIRSGTPRGMGEEGQGGRLSAVQLSAGSDSDMNALQQSEVAEVSQTCSVPSANSNLSNSNSTNTSNGSGGGGDTTSTGVVGRTPGFSLGLGASGLGLASAAPSASSSARFSWAMSPSRQGWWGTGATSSDWSCSRRWEEDFSAGSRKSGLSSQHGPSALAYEDGATSQQGVSSAQSGVTSMQGGSSQGGPREDVKRSPATQSSSAGKSSTWRSGSVLGMRPLDLLLAQQGGVHEHLSKFLIDARALEIGPVVATGSSGEVRRGRYEGQEVAVKVLKGEIMLGATEGSSNGSRITRSASNKMMVRAEFRREVMALMASAGSCEQLLPLVGVCVDSCQRLCIVTKFMEHGTLHDLLELNRLAALKTNSARGLPLPHLLSIAEDVAIAMQFLHKHGIIHRDLKSANVFLADGGRAVVGDLGVARLKGERGEMTKEVGTYRWMAPEAFGTSAWPVTTKSDVYSFAVLLWEMLTGELPYDGYSPLQAAVAVALSGLRPPLPSSCPPALAELIQSCWEKDPKQRPSFPEIVKRIQAMRKELR